MKQLRLFFLGSFLLLLLAARANELGDTARSAARPLNILLFTADDLDRNSLGCYGSRVAAITPNIDRFAGGSLLFRNAFVNSAICVPSRAIIATGLYEHRSGVNGFHKMKEGSSIPLLMELLGVQGYELGILGKVGHSTPKKEFRWHFSADAEELGNGRSPQGYYEQAKAFLLQAKEKGKPFYFMVNSHDPHRPFFNPSLPLKEGEERPSRVYAPGEIEVPGFVPDLPGVREELSFYYNSTRRLDDTFGRVLQALEESGEGENTLVVFLSDNGISLPFAKANAYGASNRTPLIIRLPGTTRAGSVNATDFVSTIDLFPTILELLRVEPPAGLDGHSFLPLLKGEKVRGRDRVYAQIDYKVGGGPTPIRSIHTKEFTYVFNGWADGARVYRSNNEGSTMKAMEAAAKGDSTLAGRVKLYRIREPEELYDLRTDPNSLCNLAALPAYAGQLEAFRNELEAWMKKTGDPLLEVFRKRADPVAARALFYAAYPEAKALDRDKQNYSASKGAREE